MTVLIGGHLIENSSFRDSAPLSQRLDDRDEEASVYSSRIDRSL